MINRMGLKGKNRNNVYKLIYDSDGISKQDIAQILNLSLPTVSQNLTELKDKGLIGEYGTFESTGGRKARVIRSINNAKLALGLDITSNHISLVLVDMQGKVLNSIRLRFEYGDTEEYYQGIGQVIDTFVEDSKINPENILGLGVSLPAIIRADSKSISYICVIKAPDNLYERMGKYIHYPFVFFNDANAGCFAEFWRRDTETPIVYVSLSNSVGGAILYSKNVYLGENQRSGEFGHITLEKDGRQCYCGQKGCADTYCNAKILSDLTDGNLQLFFENVDKGDSECTAAFQEYLNYLALLVNNLRMSFDCDVVLGGYVGSHMENHVSALTEMANLRNPFEKDGNYVKVCNYKFEASAVGAALHYLDDYINNI
ncbi:ROK family transcriptional regulator [Clostridium aminobutyricum]|uniref:ROK family transcriptional regulator n=1 Tax=Clostridium aminobutyricum TaxID=33953 RepID=A0A939D842_CLOAM|nr:ROK family transcriptional regulator [Clostridium aminobutyricum]MBN7772822.1 ROK family transcriptional regulator [Clostridium aminobutyricum]